MQQELIDTIKRIKVSDLIPYINNARIHTDEQIAQIASSIEEFGFTNPILTDGKNGVIAGHGRLLAAQKLELIYVPVIELSHLTEEQKRAYVIADNQIALNAHWDLATLRTELLELDHQGFDLSLTGFNLQEIEKITLDDSASIKPLNDFKEVDESEMAHRCPKCGFEYD